MIGSLFMFDMYHSIIITYQYTLYLVLPIPCKVCVYDSILKIWYNTSIQYEYIANTT